MAYHHNKSRCNKDYLDKVVYISQIIVTFIVLDCVRPLRSQSTDLGDNFEILPNNDHFSEIIQVSADLATPSNVLVLTNSGDLYSTSNHLSLTESNTDYLMNRLPPFIQLSPNIIVFMTINDSCLCQLDRISKKISPVYNSSSCARNCDDFIWPKWGFQYLIFSDARDQSYLFTMDLGSRNFILRHYSLPSHRQREFGEVRTRQIKVSEYKLMFGIHSDEASYNLFDYEQINSHLYAAGEDRIWRGRLPPLQEFNSINGLNIIFVEISGSVKGNIDGPAKRALYHSPWHLAKINNTMLALTDRGNSRIRLLDLSTNTTSSLCLSYALQSSTCSLVGANKLFFVNGSLYVTWQGGWGRIYHSNYDGENAGITALMDKDEAHVTVIVVSSLSPLPVLAILISAVVYLWYKRQKIINKRMDRDGLCEDSPNDTMTTSPRPLPSITGNIVDDDDDECYDMPYVDDGDIYDMIGDQDYDMIRDSDESDAINDQMISRDDIGQFVIMSPSSITMTMK